MRPRHRLVPYAILKKPGLEIASRAQRKKTVNLIETSFDLYYCIR